MRINAARRSRAVVTLCAVTVVTVCSISQGWPARLRLHSSLMPRQQGMPSAPPPLHGPSSAPTRLAGHCDRSAPALSNSNSKTTACIPEVGRETDKTFDKCETELHIPAEGMETQQSLHCVCYSASYMQKHFSAFDSAFNSARSCTFCKHPQDLTAWAILSADATTNA